MTRQIPLTRGMVALVDDEDFDRISSVCWFASEKRGRFYAARIVGSKNARTCIAMHREILGAVPGEYVDHKDGDSLDNRRANLRRCTNGQNLANWYRPRGRTGLRGVHLVRRHDCCLSRPWVASLTKAGKRIHVGYYRTKQEAALAYDKAAILVHKQFARTNTLKFCTNCLCTEERACVTDEGPCGWADATQTLCTACDGKEEKKKPAAKKKKKRAGRKAKAAAEAGL